MVICWFVIWNFNLPECGATEDEDDEEQLDKNGKRGEFGANEDEDDEDEDDDDNEEFAIWTSHSFWPSKYFLILIFIV